jgi:hypothetical protein
VRRSKSGESGERVAKAARQGPLWRQDPSASREERKGREDRA